jgi:glycosyltransferase involved in cell wall biosynthesis
MAVMESKLRVLVLLPSLISGGAERQTIDLINNLHGRGLELNLCYFKRIETLRKSLNEDSLQGLFCLEKSRGVDIALLRKLVKIIRDFNPHRILCVNMYTGLYGLLARRLACSDSVLLQSIHSTVINDTRHKIILRLIYRYSINMADRIIFVSRNQMNYWLDTHGIDPAKSLYIYNGIDLDSFRPELMLEKRGDVRAQHGFLPSDIVLGMCATLTGLKRHVDLVDAAMLLRARNYPVKLLFIGDGEERERIMAHAYDKGMGEYVHITGFQSDVRPFVAACDIMVVASISEALSMSVLESMAMKKPVVATDVGGIPEQISHGVNGFLFQPFDVHALSNYIEQIIQNGLAEEMGDRSRSIIAEKFSRVRMIDEYEKVLKT